MKTLITLVVAFILLATNSRAAMRGAETIIGHGKNKSLFVFRAKKKFVGATLEVYSSKGKLVTAQSLNKRKMVIDFGDVSTDTYTIRLVKGTSTKEYRFIKG